MFVTQILSNTVHQIGHLIQDTVDEVFFHLSQVGYCKDKKWAWLKYWPSILSGSLAVASTVSAIAMYCMKNIGMTVVHSIVALGTALLAGTLHIFIPFKKLEEQTQVFESETAKLQEQNSVLQHQSAALQKLNQELDVRLVQRAKEHQELIVKMDEHTRELRAVTDRLTASDEKRLALEELVKTLTAANHGMKTYSEVLEHLQQNLADKGPQILTTTRDLTTVSVTLAHQIGELKARYQSSQEELQSACAFAENLSKTLVSMQEIFRLTKESEARLQEQVATLQKTSSTFGQAEDSFKQSLDTLAHSLERAQQQAAQDFARR